MSHDELPTRTTNHIEAEPLPREEPIPFPDALRKALLDSPTLLQMKVPPKKRILGEFMREGDIGIVYAPRGLGKTWLTSLMARSIAEATTCGEWSPGIDPTRALIIDGEMALAQTQERSRLLELDSANLQWIHHEHLFNQCERTINIACPQQQIALTDFILGLETKVVFLDNLSTLACGVKENDADDWEKISPWLLTLRRHNIAIVLVCHAGKNGTLRGTSRREDLVTNPADIYAA